MGRPPDYEWAVLGEGQDPIPGDPQEVRDESNRLGRMAQTLRDQIGLLKKIQGDENLNVGKYADKIRSTATELTGDLEKVATRYESVATYLGNWASDLEYSQSESLRALAKAQQAAPTANAPEMKPAPGSPQPKLTPQQEQQQAAAQKAKEAAQGEIADAKRQLDNAKNHRDDRGRYWMQKIEDSDHDDLKDGFWDGVSNWIHEHAGLIKLLADVCTWIVTGLVILSLLIPGLDIATGILAGFMIAALVGHTALALNGDGSWTDVAMDVFALATLGAASWAKGALEGSADLATGLGKVLGDGSEVEEGGEATAKLAADGADPAEEASQGFASRAWSAVSDWGKAVGEKFMAGGEKDVVENMEKINNFAEQFPNTRLGANIVQRAGGLVNAVRVINGSANIADQFGHWAGGSDAINFIGNLAHGHGFEDGDIFRPITEGDTSPSWGAFNDFKEMTTAGIGS
ncbi:hypothetical protein NGB36_18720 [Streptomyces sp. RB6PN25]|uniref:WXG100 family type VII secretion target n=1 Tax=Streptomyces humicola TaxID=2953240 RepID=A0ABT1Q1C7_9ACTN|nr:hypothetical protein [Streptomyces humicola]MCQ4082580.1 hypothetical protein [Streptomyces humicola]